MVGRAPVNEKKRHCFCGRDLDLRYQLSAADRKMSSWTDRVDLLEAFKTSELFWNRRFLGNPEVDFDLWVRWAGMMWPVAVR